MSMRGSVIPGELTRDAKVMYKHMYSSFHCSSIVCVCRPGGKLQRAEPWQLRQENSDAVWNELTYFKNLTRKLTVEK